MSLPNRNKNETLKCQKQTLNH